MTDTRSSPSDHPPPGTPTEAAPHVVFYWRPGCGFCRRLRRGLDAAGVTLVERNIWNDPAAAAFVRSVAGGNETVPTVVVGAAALVNPSVDEILTRLGQPLPQPRPSRWTRWVGRLLGDTSDPSRGS